MKDFGYNHLKIKVCTMCVSQLTVVGEKRWDANKINNFFPDAVANAILSVSTFESVQEDKLIWNEGKEG
jgi:hypothetical protein